jgi:hypothetical protein
MNARTVSLWIMSLAVLSGYLLWQRHERRLLLEDLSRADRQAVYASTISGFKKLCVDRRGAGFEKYCEAQRDFLELFPECDTGCVRLLAKAERVPTR